MSLSAEQAQTSLLDRIGTARTLDAYVVGVAFLEGGLLAAALGDGRVAFIKSESTSPPSFVSVHDGPCLSLAVDLGEQRVLTGGDDARLVSTDTDGETTEIAAVAGRWVEPIAVSRASGLCAAVFGKTVSLFRARWKRGRSVRSCKHGRRSGIRSERAADRRRALWRSQPLVGEAQHAETQTTQLVGLAPDPDLEPGRKVRRHRNAGERAARLACLRRRRHAHVRLPDEGQVDELAAEGKVSGDRWR